MSGLIKMEIIGNVGNVDELKYLPSGVPVLNFSVAVNTVSGSGENRTEKVTWIRVALWRQLAESLKPYIVKGKQVYVEGTPSVRAYANGQGEPACSLDLNANSIQLLGSRVNGETEEAVTEVNGDIPF